MKKGGGAFFALLNGWGGGGAQNVLTPELEVLTILERGRKNGDAKGSSRVRCINI